MEAILFAFQSLIVEVGKISLLGEFHYPFHFIRLHFYKSFTYKRPTLFKNLDKL